MTQDARLHCAACESGRFKDSKDVEKVHSNVRRWINHESTVWRCPACNSLNSLEKVDLSAFYDTYPFRKRKLDGFTRKVFRRYVHRLKQMGLQSGSTVLDYGCSEGLLLDYLREVGITKVAGYDAYVEEFSNTDVLECVYDFVIAQDVIEHVEQPAQLFNTLVSLVKPGGILCIGTPCADTLDLKQKEFYIHSLHQPFHICILSEFSLLHLSEQHGLILEKMYRRHILDTPFPFVNWTFLRAYLEKLDGTLDAGFDPPQILVIAKSPKLLLGGMFGYFFPSRTEMMAYLRKP